MNSEEVYHKALLEIIQEQKLLIDYLLQDDRPELKEANQRIRDRYFELLKGKE